MAAMKNWGHDELAADLAGHVRGDDVMVWCDVQLGPAASPRPDVYVLHKSFVHPNPVAYEVKVSRADFLSDVTSGKWSKYLAYADAVWFAAPEGIVTKADVPDRAGLLVRTAEKWRTLKRAIQNPLVSIPQEALLKLIMEWRHRPATKSRCSPGESFAKKFGWEAARYVSDKIGFISELERLKDRRADEIEQAECQARTIREKALTSMSLQYKALCSVLGLPENTDRYKIAAAIEKVRAKRVGPEKEQLKEVIDHLRRLVQGYERTEESCG